MGRRRKRKEKKEDIVGAMRQQRLIVDDVDCRLLSEPKKKANATGD